MNKIVWFMTVFFGGSAITVPAHADHAIAMHGKPKYVEDFKHFDYVEPAAKKGGELRLARIGTFDSVHPYIIRGVRAAGLGLTNLALLQRSMDEPFTLYAGLAESIDAPADRKSITFHLRSSARFHDGSEVTAQDIAFSWQALRDKGRPNHQTYYKDISNIRIAGPRSITFDFKDSSNRELPLIMGLMPVLSKAEFVQQPFDKVTTKALTGTGPYRIEKLDSGHFIRYRRIEGHWTESLPAYRGRHNFDYIRYDYFRDRNSAVEAFRAGAVDVWVETDARAWATGFNFPAAKNGKVKRAEFAHQRSVGMFAIALNSRRPQLSDPRVRQAIALTFDFSWVNKNLYHGAYVRTQSFYENSELAAPDIDEPKSDVRSRLRQARKLLQEAGWQVKDNRLVDQTGKVFRFELMMLRKQNEKLLGHMVRNLERLGIEVNLRLVDSAQYQDRTTNYDFDAMIYRWISSLSPGNEQAYYWGSAAADRPGTRNYPGIKDQRLDELIRTLSDAPDRATLVRTTRAMDQILRAGHYVVPLFHQKVDRVMYWDKFQMPQTIPTYGYQIDTWWQK